MAARSFRVSCRNQAEVDIAKLKAAFKDG